jgi:lipid II:glycine glycyltransferase (peptidoglycan interpeptide bridge formation enzyme)
MTPEPKVRLVPCDDRGRFDAFVAASPFGHIHQSYEWGQIKSGSGWKPLRYLAEKEGRVVAAVSLLKTRRRGVTVLYASRGPVVDYSDGELVRALLRELEGVARREKAHFLRVSPAVRADDASVAAALRDGGFLKARKPLQHTSTALLNLAGRSPDELLASFHEKTRYNIRVAAKNGVEVRRGGEADVAVFQSLLLKMSERQEVEIFPPEFFAAVYRELAPRSMAALYLAYWEGRPTGGIFILRFAGKAWYMWGGFDYAHRKRMPSYALHWAAIRDCLSEGMKVYDFQGMPENPAPGDPLWGIYNFKKGFRGEIVRWLGEWDKPFRWAPLYKAAHRLGAV